MAAVNLQTFLYTLPEAARRPFSDYIHANRNIWEAFEARALRAAKIKKHYGAKSIIECIRWDCEIEQRGEFKANNNFTAYMARLFIYKYPQYRNLFELREINGLKEAA